MKPLPTKMLTIALLVTCVIGEALLIKAIAAESSIIRRGGDHVTIASEGIKFNQGGKTVSYPAGQYVMTNYGLHRIPWYYRWSPLAIATPLLLTGAMVALLKVYHQMAGGKIAASSGVAGNAPTST